MRFAALWLCLCITGLAAPDGSNKQGNNQGNKQDSAEWSSLDHAAYAPRHPLLLQHPLTNNQANPVIRQHGTPTRAASDGQSRRHLAASAVAPRRDGQRGAADRTRRPDDPDPARVTGVRVPGGKHTCVVQQLAGGRQELFQGGQIGDQGRGAGDANGVGGCAWNRECDAIGHGIWGGGIVYRVRGCGQGYWGIGCWCCGGSRGVGGGLCPVARPRWTERVSIGRGFGGKGIYGNDRW